jgi:hypothetical protein
MERHDTTGAKRGKADRDKPPVLPAYRVLPQEPPMFDNTVTSLVVCLK